MSALWSAQEAAAATGGRLTGRPDWTAQGVSIDSRTLQPGDLFVALRAARDGHGFVGDALARGAAAALVDHTPDGVPADAPLLDVADTQTALEALGAAARARSTARRIAVTGSVGKTTTKAFLSHTLSAFGSVHAAEASYNNHWGVPLTLARMPREADFAVFELGMNAPGEIAALTAQVRPHVAIITAIGAAHIGRLGSLDAIAWEKASIMQGLETGGVAIVPADWAEHEALRTYAAQSSAHRVRLGGDEARVVSAVLSGLEGLAVEVALGDERLAFRLASPGVHDGHNALAVLAAVKALGLDLNKAAAALGTASLPGGRGAVERVGEILLLDGSYNANPPSMTAALDALAGLNLAEGARRFAVLGDMAELGTFEAASHQEILAHIAGLPIEGVFLAGEAFAKTDKNVIGQRLAGHFTDINALSEALRTALRPGDAVLIKGSRIAGLERVATVLRQHHRETEGVSP